MGVIIRQQNNDWIKYKTRKELFESFDVFSTITDVENNEGKKMLVRGGKVCFL